MWVQGRSESFALPGRIWYDRLMTNFVNEYVDQYLTEFSVSEPNTIAVGVFERIEGDGLTDLALEIVLPIYIRSYLSQRRGIPQERGAVTDDTTHVEFEYDLSDDESTPRIKSTSSARSTRVAAVKNDWLRQLQTPLYVGDSWKRLADCTSDDLFLVAADLRRAAEGNLTKAAYYESLAAIIPEGSVLGDLTENPLVTV